MRRLALVTAASSVLMLAVAVLIIPPTEQSEIELTLAFSVFALAFVTVGAVLATRRQHNAVGWLMLSAGAVMSVPVVMGTYAGYALFGAGGDLPAGRLAAWPGTWLYIAALGLLDCLLLVFPDGQLVGRRRPAVLVVAVATLAATGAQAVLPGEMDGFPGIANPFGVEVAETPSRIVFGVSASLLALAFLAGVASIFLRLRTASGDERQQLKLFGYATALFVLAQSVNALPLGLDSSLVGLLAVVGGLLAMPLAIGLAVLRYRLYDIDLVIKRTLVYGALSALLAGVYLGSVLFLQLVLRPVTDESDLAIAASTLGVAALFRPARTRIQGVVDRRFYRHRYDADQTLESFGARLRSQLDLDELGADLRAAVKDTMEPAHVSLWLRGVR